ncbi:MAG: metallopeptidase family protein [Candidatus Pacebacteria bacterium]|nr:metallopeptidase family protein [Candidatus Paceibacterota bacterium]
MFVDWEKYIDDGILAIPEQYRDKIKNVAILLEDDPSDEVRVSEGLGDNETLLGLYQGVPLPDRGEGYGVGAPMPDTITIYKNPTLEEAEDTDGDVARVIRETIWHEFGHYFGLDEDEVRRRENGRGLV